MPSLDLSGKKKEKSSDMIIEKTLEFDSPKEMKIKKEKKSKSKKLASDSETEKITSSGVEKKSKKEKKRKAAEVDDDGGGEGEGSQTSLELGEPINMTNSEGKKGNKKAKVVDSAEDESDDGELTKEEEHPHALSKFRLSEKLKEALIANNITFLYDIQAMTFNDILDGKDLVGRAVTGTGKTLAFLLPILESLANQQQTKEYGRLPSVLVLLPTRELAIQVFKEFEVYGGALGKKSCCLYGQTPYREQEMQLRRGVDIVVGTPGRVKDLIERGCLDFSSLKFRVLDEADEMLKMGFVDDVELILGKVKDSSKVQTLLFSATLPDWVKQISTKFLKPDKKTADLVGNKKMKASASVKHLVLPCSVSEIPKLIPDIIRCYSSGGRTIIFTEKKESASELAGLLPGARALHGDIQQSQREVTLNGFRSGKFKILVATNVAARGLDIDDVQLIIQCEPPRQVEAYIHRSGRTGRAGNSGIAIMLFDPRKSNISKIERESGVKFEHISAPQSADIARFIGAEIAKKITEVSDSVVPAFKHVAEELLNNSNVPPAVLLAKAIAKAAGYSEIKNRSLLTSMENYVTLLLECGKPVYSPSFAYVALRKCVPVDKVESIQGLSLTADGNGAVFDVTSEDLAMFLAGQKNAAGVKLTVVTTLPQLQDREEAKSTRFGGRNGSYGRFSGGRRGGYSDRRNDQFSRGRGGGGGGRGNTSRKW